MQIRYVFSVLALLLCLSLNAQEAPDFTVVDIEGNEINLYSILDEGKVVVLDCSATWCPPCWQFHEGHFLKDIHEKYGPDGTDQVRVIFYEADANTTSEDLNGTGSNTQGDWVTDVPYQIVDENPVQLDGNIFWPLGYPTINVIRPDDKMIVADLYDPWVGGLGLEGMEDIIEGAFPTTSNVAQIEDLQISVFPNPTTDLISINLANYEGAMDLIEVTNTLGAIVATVKVTDGANAVTVDVANVPTGLYILNFTENNELVGTKTIIKE